MTLNLTRSPTSFYLLTKKLAFVREYKYLGVTISNKRQTSLITQHISNILEKAEKRVNCIRHYGFQCDGLRPATSIMLYTTLVRPILEYAAQVISYKHYYYRSTQISTVNFSATIDQHILKLEAFQNKVLKKLIPCPKSTSPAIIRLITGVMPISARIEILKLRYFWNLSHSHHDNPAFSILKHTRANLSNSKVGFAHEVYNLCGKLNCLDIWLTLRRHKENPLNTIKRIVETHYLKADIEKSVTTPCLFISLLVGPEELRNKKYMLVQFFNYLGVFPNTTGRNHFIFALLDRCNFERKCLKCGKSFNDILAHMLKDCKGTFWLRARLKAKLVFFNAPQSIDVTNKTHLFRLALSTLAFGNNTFLIVLCEFLISVNTESVN